MSDIETEFKRMGAIWEYPGEGFHADFTLANKHSDFYFNSNWIVKEPEILNNVTRRLKTIVLEKGLEFDWIVSYPPYGTPVAQSLAHALGKKFGYVQSTRDFRIFFDLGENEKVLLVADDIFGGSTLRKTIDSVASTGATVIDAIVVIANFLDSGSICGREIISLYQRKINLWDPENCPLCQKGSRPLSARENWPRFIENQEKVKSGRPPE